MSVIILIIIVQRVLLLVKINHMTRKCLSSAGAYQCIVPLSQCVIGSLENLMFKLDKIYIIFVVNIKFPREIYHTIVTSTEELYCLLVYTKPVDSVVRVL